jgi:tetratricopeptide (TPR) repeat protein
LRIWDNSSSIILDYGTKDKYYKNIDEYVKKVGNKLGLGEEAIENLHFREISKKEFIALILDNFAHIYFGSRGSSKNIELRKMAIDLFNYNWNDWGNLLILSIVEEKPELFIEYAKKYENILENEAEYNTFMGFYYAANNDNKKSKQFIDKIQGKNEVKELLYIMKAWECEEIKDTRGMLEYLYKAKEFAPLSIDVLNQFQLYYNRRGDYKKEAKVLEEYIEKMDLSFGGTIPEVYYLCAKAFLADGQNEKAKKYYIKAKERGWPFSAEEEKTFDYTQK